MDGSTRPGDDIVPHGAVVPSARVLSTSTFLLLLIRLALLLTKHRLRKWFRNAVNKAARMTLIGFGLAIWDKELVGGVC